MGSSGGKGNSKAQTSTNSTTNTSTTNVNTVDNRIVEGDNARIGGNVTLNSGDTNAPISITTTDQGAVQAGLDLALEAIGFAGDTQAGIKSVASDSISQAYDLAQQARQSETSGAINNFVKYGTWIALAALLAWVAVKRKG